MKRRNKEEDEATVQPPIADDQQQQLIVTRIRAQVDIHPAATRSPRAAVQVYSFCSMRCYRITKAVRLLIMLLDVEKRCVREGR